MRFFYVLLISVSIAACGGGETGRPNTETADAIGHDTVDVVDTTWADLPESAADAAEDDAAGDGAAGADGANAVPDDDARDVGPLPEEQGASEDRTNGNAPAGLPPLSGRYELASVDGDAMPMIIDENPDCRVELVRGDLWIREDRSFQLRASSRTTCGGEVINDDVRTAEGTVDISEDRLDFEATSGEFFATAAGRFTEAGHINIDTLEMSGEATAVDWRFER